MQVQLLKFHEGRRCFLPIRHSYVAEDQGGLPVSNPFDEMETKIFSKMSALMIRIDHPRGLQLIVSEFGQVKIFASQGTGVWDLFFLS